MSSIGAYQPNATIGAFNPSEGGNLIVSNTASDSTITGVNLLLLGNTHADDVNSSSEITNSSINVKREISFDSVESVVEVSDSNSVRVIKIYIDPREAYQPKLPELRIESNFGWRGSLYSKLPTLKLESQLGWRSNNLELPALELTANLFSLVNGRLNKKLPSLTLVGSFASRLNSKLPALSIEASGIVGNGTGSLVLDKKLPALQIISQSNTNHITLDVNFPALDLIAAGSMSITGELYKTLPGLKLSASFNLNVISTLDSTLPELQITATGYCNSMALNKNLPTLIMQPYASGDNYGPSINIMINDRFIRSLLQYNRWAI